MVATASAALVKSHPYVRQQQPARQKSAAHGLKSGLPTTSRMARWLVSCRLTNLRGNHVGTIEHLFVPDVDQRSLGQATAFVAGLVDFAREQGMSLLEAYSTTANMEESL